MIEQFGYNVDRRVLFLDHVVFEDSLSIQQILIIYPILTLCILATWRGEDNDLLRSLDVHSLHVLWVQRTSFYEVDLREVTQRAPLFRAWLLFIQDYNGVDLLKVDCSKRSNEMKDVIHILEDPTDDNMLLSELRVLQSLKCDVFNLHSLPGCVIL